MVYPKIFRLKIFLQSGNKSLDKIYCPYFCSLILKATLRLGELFTTTESFNREKEFLFALVFVVGVASQCFPTQEVLDVEKILGLGVACLLG
jgi:hypothetical protein